MNKSRTKLKSCLAALLLTGLVPNTVLMQAADGDAQWEKVQAASQIRPYPTEWQTSPPSPETVAAFQEENAQLALKAADLAKAFVAEFPDHEKVSEAKSNQKQMLRAALEFGNAEAGDALMKLDISDTEKFQIRSIAVQQKAMAKQSEGREAVLTEFEKGVRDLEKEFPGNAEIPQMLLFIAENLGNTKGKAIAQELADKATDENIRTAARGLLEKLSLPGSKLDLAFTAVDGREVDIKALKGKVVLIDFWATWCGPCVQELPNVKAAYAELHPKGFEIIGISFDQNKGKLTSFVQKQEMPWVQYFDGQGWQNAFGQKYGITAIPAMWLVNKEGVLVDMNARDGLAGKVEALLAE